MRNANNESNFPLNFPIPRCQLLVNNTLTATNDTRLVNLRRGVSNYARENMVKLTVFVRDPYVEKYLREEKITEITFAGNIGGLLGLFTGFSFMSAVEILYILFFTKSKVAEEPFKVQNIKSITSPFSG